MGFLEEREFDDVPSIPQYFKEKTIFITGGSGFMGKVLIEKLLYSCSELGRIYLLLRCKKGVQPEERLSDLYSSPCFDRLRREKPHLFESKVFVIPGDVMEIGLGMSEADRARLVNSVNIIFHAAASVRFDDLLKFAATMNLRGSREVIELAKEIKNLSSLVHVSTSYANTNQNPVEEIMYPPHANWRDVLEICQEIDEHTLKVLTPKMLGCMPNTYAFTKQLAEHVVYESRGQLPAVIFRPSIVISSVNEPMKGWLENFNGPVGLLVAGGKGILRSFHTDPNIRADYMPVDVSIKAMITAAWSRGTKKLNPTDDIPIYNCCSGNLINITMGEMIKMGQELSYTVPFDNSLWSTNSSITKSATVNYVKVIFLHLLPALIVDTILWVLGKKPMLVKLQRRIFTANLALAYYVTRQWTFDNKNFISLRSSIKEKDRKLFFDEVETIELYTYLLNSMKVARKYLLKEKDEDLPKARTHHTRMWIVDKVVQCTFYGFLIWRVVNMNCVQNFAHNLLNIVV